MYYAVVTPVAADVVLEQIQHPQSAAMHQCYKFRLTSNAILK